jgi:hypothetical protein
MYMRKELLLHLVETTIHDLPVTLWVIWIAHGKAIHEAMYQNLGLVMDFVHKIFSDKIVKEKITPMRDVLPLQPTLDGFRIRRG